MALTEELRARLLALQRNEITEYHIYRRLAARVKSPDNRETLNRIADEERGHYEDWKRHTGRDVERDRFRRRFLEMAGISLGVAGFSFVIGFLVRNFLAVEA
jgi:demethoxyubiquinone hydroxylase (CLK1/Coq7/Cat5 family)